MRDAAIEAFKKDHAAAMAAFAYLEAIETGAIGRAYCDVIVQANDQIDTIDFVEAYWFARIHAAIYDGLIAFTSVVVGSQPLANGDEAGNQAILGSIRGPISVAFSPGRGNRGDAGDGTASWAAPLELRTHGGSIIVEPGSAPLEVGTTRATTTFRHLTTGAGAVARWPYGSDNIWLLVRLPAFRIGTVE